jgi:hypothetical protein
MPANLTPEYEKAELRYRQATSDEDRLAALQALRGLYDGGGAQTPNASGPQQSLAPRPIARLALVAVSAHTRQGLDDWFRRLWELLAMIRVYSKEPGRAPNLQKPL